MVLQRFLVFTICLLLVGITQASAQTTEVEEFSLRVTTSPNILYISGAGFYPVGTLVTLDPVPERWQEYEFVGWKIDGMWTSENPPRITMNRSHDVVAVYSQSLGFGEIKIDTIPRASDITVDGTIYLSDELPISFDWEVGSTHSIIISDVVKQNANTRFKFDSWKDLNTEVIRAVTIGEKTNEFVAIYKLQHYLKPVTEIGVAIGGGWQDQGSSATFELESDTVIDRQNENIRYVFDSWDSGDYKNSPSNIIDVSEPITVNAFWNKEYKLDISTTVLDYNIYGAGWHPAGRQVVLIAEEYLESDNKNEQYVFEKWVSKGPNPVIIPNAQSSTTSITVDQPYSIQALYTNSYKVNVWTPYSSGVGGGYYPDGQIAEISIQQKEVVVDQNKVKKVFSGWDTGTAKRMDFSDSTDEYSGTQNLLLIVDRPLNVTAKWKTQYYLDVQSAEGKVKGSGWYDMGRLVPISVETASIPLGMWSKISFDGWHGDYVSESTNGRVIISGPKTVIAEWKEDNSPAIANSFILALVGISAIIVYSKTRNGQLAKLSKRMPKKVKREEEVGFEKFFNTRSTNFNNLNTTPMTKSQKPMSKILDWLLGRNG